MKDITMGTTTFSGPVVSTNGFVTGGYTITGPELATIDGVTPGTAAAGKAVVLNSSKGISTITSATFTNATITNAAITKLAGVPTADPHVVGAIWNNSGVVTISAG